MQVEAVKKDYDSIRYIKDPNEKVQIEAVKNHWSAIKYIEKPTVESQKIAISQSEEAITYIDIYNEERIKEFLKVNINILKYIYEDVTEELIDEVLMEKLKDEDIEEKYVKDFLNLEILDIDKIKFIYNYGSKKAKKILIDYKLAI